ncbi:hypothetical protein DFA_11929 [Cavenderia fasciculata]|uniref:Uncharacterized protein n=1 Tax=Cavenderia fasciculata TaxID=261658 RepID=F4QEV3_CACFS|nr:uncharacterized protein DFA_11929 [Cavenderia fasciculata]EGG14160.1 hypothetical protein DFA_11929 [Cavenderia fasciculata]|eukprot:XP_004350868.1 hypothetical protein DFA_11929 [Cavenderia fasciculata]
MKNTFSKFKNNVVNAFSNGPKTTDTNFETARREFTAFSEATNNTYQSLVKHDKNLKKTFIDPSSLNKNIQKYFVSDHPLCIYTTEVLKQVEFSFNDWVESQKTNYDLLQQYVARIKFIRESILDRDGVVGELDRSAGKIKDLQAKPSKDPHKLPNEQNFYNAKKEQYDVLNYKLLSDISQFFEDKQSQFDRPLQNIILSLGYLFTSISTNHSKHTALLEKNPPYFNPVKDLVGVAPTSYTTQESIGKSFDNPPPPLSLRKSSSPPIPNGANNNQQQYNGNGHDSYQPPQPAYQPPQQQTYQPPQPSYQPPQPSYQPPQQAAPPPRPVSVQYQPPQAAPPRPAPHQPSYQPPQQAAPPRPAPPQPSHQAGPPPPRPSAPGVYPGPGVYKLPAQQDQQGPPPPRPTGGRPQLPSAPTTQYQPPSQYQPPTQYQPPSQYQPPTQYQPPQQQQQQQQHQQYQPPQYNPQQSYDSDFVNEQANGYATSVVTNPEYQRAAGNAAANKANDPRVQGQVGGQIANNTSNPYLKSAASNSKVQGAAGKGFGFAARNETVQNAAGNAAANQINNRQY